MGSSRYATNNILLKEVPKMTPKLLGIIHIAVQLLLGYLVWNDDGCSSRGTFFGELSAEG